MTHRAGRIRRLAGAVTSTNPDFRSTFEVMTASEVPFSELIQHPKATVAKLKASGSRSLRLERRGDPDLVLTTVERAEQESTVISAVTRTFVALVQRGEEARSLLVDVVSEAFPWVRFLPPEDRSGFVAELVDVMRAAGSLETPNPAPVVQVIAEWQHTAEVHADPELARLVRQESDDFGPVPVPTTRV